MGNLLTIEASNLSVAWAKAFLALMKPGARQFHPAIVTIGLLHESPSVEDARIRQRLDQELERLGESQIRTVSNTIFPQSLWNPEKDAGSLYQRYEKAWPAISKCPANRNGVYFRRLTSYAPRGSAESVNQLEFIKNTYLAGNHRKSALQAAILDPTRDHTNNRQKGFPCLHQVAFTPDGANLSVTGFYATQYHFEKSYGNYLGLHNLGIFMAHQLKLTLQRVTCIATTLERGKPSKGQLAGLALDIEKVL